MIGECRHCHRPYWRYRPDHPPPGFCSWPHKAKGATRKQAPPPRLPAELARIMREHRALMHWQKGAAANPWLDCETCDDLETEYAESLAWHISADRPQPLDSVVG